MSDLAIRGIVDVLLSNWIEDSGQHLAVSGRRFYRFPWAHRAQFLDAYGSAIAITRDGCSGGLDDMGTIRQSLLHLGDSLRLVWFVSNHCGSILQTGHTGCGNDCDLSRSHERRA